MTSQFILRLPLLHSLLYLFFFCKKFFVECLMHLVLKQGILSAPSFKISLRENKFRISLISWSVKSILGKTIIEGEGKQAKWSQTWLFLLQTFTVILIDDNGSYLVIIYSMLCPKCFTRIIYISIVTIWVITGINFIFPLEKWRKETWCYLAKVTELESGSKPGLIFPEPESE